MVAGLMANTNLDDGKQTRNNILADIEAKHLDTIAMIYNGKSDAELDYEQDPLIAAINVDRTPESIPTTDTNEEFEIDQ
jgi:hypothetical protein